MERWQDTGGDSGWLALRDLIPELMGMTDEDKLKWVSLIRGERTAGREGSLCIVDT